MKQLLSLLFLLALALPVGADVTAPGEVSLEVADRGAGARSEALSEGLRRVLVRLTGMREPQQSAQLSALLEADPSRWVLQYSYQEMQEDGGSEQGREDEDAPSLTLAASFDVPGLSRRLARLGAPVWGTQRPAVLFWLVEQGVGRGEFIGREDRGDSAQELRRTARERGLPVTLPELDGTDRGRVRPADVRGRFDEPVLEASERYGNALVVTAVLYDGSSPRLRWRLFEQGRQQREGEITEGSRKDMLAGLVHGISDYVAELYAVRGGQGRQMRLRIRELSELADWKTARDHLAGLAGMEALHVDRLDGATATFIGRFSGSRAQLERLARLLPDLRDCPREMGPPADPSGEEVAEDGPDAENELEFCWGR